MSGSSEQASWGELLSGRNGLRSLAVAGGVALHAINVYIAVTILPSVVRDIGGLEYYAWNMTLFVAASIMSSALSAKANDAFGLKNAFLVAIVIFSIGTAACALAPSMFWMLAGRTVQGAGGGLLLGLCYSSIRVVFEERLWPRAVALTSSMWGVSTLSGPAIGGIFAQSGNWRWAYGAILPVAFGLAWLVITQINASTTGSTSAPTQRIRAPVGKIALVVLSVLVVSMGSLSTHVGWNALGVFAGLGIAVLVARSDMNADIPLLPRGSYALHEAMGSIYACVALISMSITVEVFIPYFLQVVHGYEPLAAGYLTALMSIGWTAGSIFSSSRKPAMAKVLLRAGPATIAVSLVALALLMPMLHLTQTYWFWVMLVPLLGVGLGIGISWPHLLSQVFRSAPVGQETIASGSVITVQLFALAMGSTIAGMIVNAAGITDPGGIQGAQSAAYALLFAFAIAPGAAFFIIGRVIRAKTETDAKSAQARATAQEVSS
tara:strand:+ start:131810 stop:133285 length:1476 start_codon:yes stop_codon:yes gene_type:complete